MSSSLPALPTPEASAISASRALLTRPSSPGVLVGVGSHGNPLRLHASRWSTSHERRRLQTLLPSASSLLWAAVGQKETTERL
eukprot:3693251-Prorocentrum_lima.AAC.1